MIDVAVVLFIAILFASFLVYAIYDLEDLIREQQHVDLLDELWADEETA